MSIALQLIAQYGVPLALEIWNTWRDNHNPTPEDWEALLAKVNKTKEQYVAEARERAASAPKAA